MQAAVETSHRARWMRPSPVAAVLCQRGGRVAYLDHLKVLLVAVIIMGHGVMGYSGYDDSWAYQPVREVRLTDVGDAVLGTLLLPTGLFVMGLFFLISGLVTPGSLTRKGPRTFARDRVVRLGIPLAVWVLAIWPALVYVAHLAAGEGGSYWWRFMRAKPFLDTGPMWFVEVLLIYSLGYAAWRRWRPRSAVPFAGHARRALNRRALTPGWTLVALAAGISLATILVRLVFPFESAQIGQSKLWQWPQYLAMFGLGIVAARRGWLDPVPDRIRRRCGATALLATVGLAALAGAAAAAGVDFDVFGDARLHWAPLGLAALEGPLAVGGAVWLLGAAQRRLDRPPGRRGRALARSSYAAFIVQGPALIGLAVALRPVDVPAEVKALAVACAAVAASFAVAWLLVTRTRLRRIL